MMMADILSSLLMLIMLAIVIVSFLYERKTHIAPVPTLPWISRAILRLLQSYKQPAETLQIAELGSGWGGLCFQIARRFPHSIVTGFEISPFPYWTSKIRENLSRKQVRFRKESFFEQDLSGYDVIVCYLSFKHMRWLKYQFEKDLKSGTIIISNAFPIPDWEPIEVASTNVLMKIPVYVYRVGELT